MKCVNHNVCGKQARPGHATCIDCKRAAERLQSNEEQWVKDALEKLETRPRTWRDVWFGKHHK